MFELEPPKLTRNGAAQAGLAKLSAVAVMGHALTDTMMHAL